MYIINNGARWIFTSLHTWIGLIYIIAGTLGGSLGTAYSLCMRWELGMPGYVLVIDNFHDYNVWITYHGILMIFFMVMNWIFFTKFFNLVISGETKVIQSTIKC